MSGENKKRNKNHYTIISCWQSKEDGGSFWRGVKVVKFAMSASRNGGKLPIIHNCLLSYTNINKQTKMGHAHVHPQFESPQRQSDDILNQGSPPPSQHLHSEQEEQWKLQPIIIPCFAIRQSPFKNYPIKDPQTTRKETTNQVRGEEEVGQEKRNENEGMQAVKQGLWNSVLYDIRILNIIFDMLPPQESLELAMLNRRLHTLFFFYRLFHRPNNWNFTAYFLHRKIQNEPKVSYHKLLNQSYHEESEHSLDLDRLQSLFLPDEDPAQQVARVDKVMRVINMSGIGYFQGLNSIIIVLVSLFSDEISYWIAMMLIKKTQSLHENPDIYMEVMGKIERQVKQKCPDLFDKLEKSDLGVEYFAMKWIMNLFSTDLNRSLVVHIWDLLLNFGLASLKWFTVSVFIHLEDTLRNIEDSDQINETLKYKLKQLTQGNKALHILQSTRILMSEQIYGEGCSEIISPWVSYKEEQIGELAHVKQLSVQDLGKNCSNMCEIEEEAHAQQETSYQTFLSEAEHKQLMLGETLQPANEGVPSSVLQESQILPKEQQQIISKQHPSENQ